MRAGCMCICMSSAQLTERMLPAGPSLQRIRIPRRTVVEENYLRAVQYWLGGCLLRGMTLVVVYYYSNNKIIEQEKATRCYDGKKKDSLRVQDSNNAKFNAEWFRYCFFHVPVSVASRLLAVFQTESGDYANIVHLAYMSFSLACLSHFPSVQLPSLAHLLRWQDPLQWRAP